MTEAPEGLRYLPDFLSEDEEHALVDALARLDFKEIHMHGVVAKRTVAHYGWDYGYESWRLSSAPPMPRFLLPIRDRCAGVVGLEPYALEEVLVSRYPPGASIGWHRDAPMFGPTVIGVSLLGAARMRFRRKVGGAWETAALELAPRSAYVLSGPARSVWQHTLSPVKQLRYSLSFRTVPGSPARLGGSLAGGTAPGF
ncbi:alpha-ketoglutarate-dependent dioxygenase AlkB [Pyxidicoccus fallax]|uniref:Alpha-ketoglutarate-dependent dioxygenase AlkB n=2 Tax=Pyxidicoccus fallax TaxID=394095 RepID=A0A848L5N3_9BACT|nr:alpha-ketoglutarate-dependent dioxygenase AlkB [Pyxidicoccus fallax]NMO13807.1 alpha-ketoglutarate-dependent dioxygenase AlkB [Pyxidicoccus fallax]NPC77006.1 alpha-ketoglutarate-dependent dioxygenase AlkB [Pyxidicoccus fallax]